MATSTYTAIYYLHPSNGMPVAATWHATSRQKQLSQPIKTTIRLLALSMKHPFYKEN
jgi:hypothetical protein